LASQSVPSSDSHTIGRGIPTSTLTDPPMSHPPEGVDRMAPILPLPCSSLVSSATSTGSHPSGSTFSGSVLVVGAGRVVVVAGGAVVAVVAVAGGGSVLGVVSTAAPSPRQAARTIAIRAAATRPCPVREYKVSPPVSDRHRSLGDLPPQPVTDRVGREADRLGTREETGACARVRRSRNVALWRLPRRASPS